MNINLKIKKITLNKLNYIEEKFYTPCVVYNQLKSGNLIKINYNIIENNKIKPQTTQGIILKLQNKGLKKTLTLYTIIDNIGIKQTFLINAPYINQIMIKKIIKFRRSKLYYLQTSKKKIIF